MITDETEAGITSLSYKNATIQRCKTSRWIVYSQESLQHIRDMHRPCGGTLKNLLDTSTIYESIEAAAEGIRNESKRRKAEREKAGK